MNSRSRLLLLAAVLLSTACASSGGGSRSGDRNRVTTTELTAGSEANLYDFVSAKRPRWFQPRGSSAIPQAGTPMTTARMGVVVYVNDTRMGSTDVLRSMARAGVREMRFYDVTEAQARFPNRETNAVIQVIMQ